MFFYYLYPVDGAFMGGWDTDDSWMIKDPRVEYIPLPTCTDRLREYFTFSKELDDIVAFNGTHWDWDIIVTARIPQVPRYKFGGSDSSGVKAHTVMRRIITVDDMSMISTRMFVTLLHEDIQEMMTINGYLTADKNYLFSYWTPKDVMQQAKLWLSPAKLMQLGKKVLPSSPVNVDSLVKKGKAFLEDTKAKKLPFTIVYTQRLESTHRNADVVLDTMLNRWILDGGKEKFRLMVTSNSKSAGGGIEMGKYEDVIEFYRPPRDEFWRIMKEETHAVLVMSLEDDYPLSLLEPLFLGVPVVVLKAPYSVSTLGADYPFFISNGTQAYGILKDMQSNYIKYYAVFDKWLRESFWPMLQERNKDYLPLLLEKDLKTFEDEKFAFMEKGYRKGNTLLQLVAESAGDEIVLSPELLDQMSKDKILRNGTSLRVNSERRFSGRLSFSESFNSWRVCLSHHYGFEDASVKVGHLRRKK